MRNETFIDKILEKILREKITQMYANRMSPKQIQEEMNISEDWIKEVIKEYDEEMREKNTTEPY
jgi:transposase-like protein